MPEAGGGTGGGEAGNEGIRRGGVGSRATVEGVSMDKTRRAMRRRKCSLKKERGGRPKRFRV